MIVFYGGLLLIGVTMVPSVEQPLCPLISEWLGQLPSSTTRDVVAGSRISYAIHRNAGKGNSAKFMSAILHNIAFREPRGWLLGACTPRERHNKMLWCVKMHGDECSGPHLSYVHTRPVSYIRTASPHPDRARCSSS